MFELVVLWFGFLKVLFWNYCREKIKDNGTVSNYGFFVEGLVQSFLDQDAVAGNTNV